ncbi:hypothetical protein [Antarcticirhabdus aurantiaca]|uniref:Uncharacterized protein n=1 Tax=Antarcticirhabdus aurantiaca TaxID=2606717 RepID=A0ACD4NK63_9HYPH|nr:hypothetical protein [Antarcticirhabdus aurantiaca]WAJ27161.1 hypothetical protein OXU80_20225 [Jeongeuplla avenae]
MDAVAWGEKPARPFREVMKRFAETHFRTLKPASAKRYAVSMKALARTFGTMTVQQVTTATLSDFETTRRSEGASAPTVRRDWPAPVRWPGSNLMHGWLIGDV